MPEFTTKQREKLAEEKEAMPDGSYPIRNRADLKRAIQAFGRSKNPEKTKAWIKRRARELDAEELIPESWKSEVQHSDYLVHYGVMGMKWHIKKKQEEVGSDVNAYKQRLAEQRANRKSTKGMTKAQRESYKSEQEAIKRENQAVKDAIEEKRADIAAMTRELAASKKRIADISKSVRKERTKVLDFMARHKIKIRIV